MSRVLIVHQVGPGVTVQDLGRPGYLGFGLSPGGAADRLALAEGAALLGQADSLAALEMAGMGGTFEAGVDLRIALTGAPMRATIDGAGITWNASHMLPMGARLVVGGAEAGSFGYLHIGGGINVPPILGSRSAHVASGLGPIIAAGDILPIGPDPRVPDPRAPDPRAPDPRAPDPRAGDTGQLLPVTPRFTGGDVRIVPSLQTDFFSTADIKRFETTAFRRDPRGSRMGVCLTTDAEGFHSEAGLSVLSEVVVPGDIQITGDGTPFVLMGECQTTGGYPRIASVLPCDLPIVAQAPPGAALRFGFVTLEDAILAERRARDHRKGLRSKLRALVRDPHDIHDLLSYQLISGMTAGDDIERGRI